MSAQIEFTVEMAISAHRALKAAAPGSGGDLEAVRQQVLSAPCRTIFDVREKARYLLEGATADCVPLIGEWEHRRSVSDPETGFEARVKTLLTSLLGPHSAAYCGQKPSASDYMASGIIPEDQPMSDADRSAGVPLSVSAAITIHHALELHDWGFWANDAAGGMIGDQEEVSASETAISFVWLQVVKAPCMTINDVRAKAAYVLHGINGRPGCVGAIDLKNPNHDLDSTQRYSLVTFLRSLCGCFPVEDPRSLLQAAGPGPIEQGFVDQLAIELKAARKTRDYSTLCELADELEAVAMHADDRSIQARARRLLDTAFDPIDA